MPCHLAKLRFEEKEMGEKKRLLKKLVKRQLHGQLGFDRESRGPSGVGGISYSEITVEQNYRKGSGDRGSVVNSRPTHTRKSLARQQHNLAFKKNNQ